MNSERGQTRRNASRLIAVAVVVGTAMAGCSAVELASLGKPQISVQDVQLTGLGLTGGSVDIRLNVHNPNLFKLEGTQLTYQLWVDSVALGSGATDQRFLVNAGDSTVVTLPLDFTWSAIGSAGRKILSSGELPYRVTGNVRVSSALGALTVPYDRSGRVTPLGGGGQRVSAR